MATLGPAVPRVLHTVDHHAPRPSQPNRTATTLWRAGDDRASGLLDPRVARRAILLSVGSGTTDGSTFRRPSGHERRQGMSIAESVRFTTLLGRVLPTNEPYPASRRSWSPTSSSSAPLRSSAGDRSVRAVRAVTAIDPEMGSDAMPADARRRRLHRASAALRRSRWAVDPGPDGRDRRSTGRGPLPSTPSTTHRRASQMSAGPTTERRRR